LPGALSHHGVNDAAWDETDGQEHQDAYQQEGGDDQEEPTNQVRTHNLVLLGSLQFNLPLHEQAHAAGRILVEDDIIYEVDIASLYSTRTSVLSTVDFGT
jgi:hypothetical protein